MKILAVTTNFGFGPSSKLVSVLNNIEIKEDTIIDFLGVGNCLDFLQKNCPNINRCIKMDSEQISGSYFNVLIQDYDLVINVMNLHVQKIIKKKINTKIVFIDSLSWMWAMQIEGILKSDLYFVQNYFIDYAKLSGLENVRIVEPILDSSITTGFKSDIEKNNNILVNVSGVFTPNEEDNFGIEYLKFYIEVFKRIDSKGFDKIVFACNQNQIDYVSKVNDINFNMIFKTFSRIDFLEYVKKSKKVFSTPGLTFYLESKMLLGESPYYLLPSNYSQSLLLEKYLIDRTYGLNLSDLDGTFIIEKNLDEMIAVELVRTYLKNIFTEDINEIVCEIQKYLDIEREVSVRDNKVDMMNGSTQIVETLKIEGFL